MNILYSCAFQPTVNFPTQITKTLIDDIFYNNVTKILSQEI